MESSRREWELFPDAFHTESTERKRLSRYSVNYTGDARNDLFVQGRRR